MGCQLPTHEGVLHSFIHLLRDVTPSVCSVPVTVRVSEICQRPKQTKGPAPLHLAPGEEDFTEQQTE